MSVQTISLLFIVSIAFSASLSNSLAISDEMISSLKSEIQHIAASTPPNSATYIANIHSQGDFLSDSFDVSQTQNVLQSKWKFPKVVIEKFKSIIFSDSLTFQTFTASLTHSVADVSEFVGTARKVGDVAEIAFIQVLSSGRVKNAIAIY